MAQTTVKDFAKTLKISEEALLKRMSSAGLSHNSATDEVTTAHKQILLRSLKQKQKQTSSSISSSSGVGIKVKSKVGNLLLIQVKLKATRTILRPKDRLLQKH